MRLLMFLSSTGAGGAERMTINLANQLAPAMEVHLVMSRGGTLGDQIEPAVRRHSLRTARARWSVVPLARTIRRVRPDVVFASKPEAAIALAAAWRLSGCRARLVLRESNHRTAQGLSPRSVFMRALAWAYRSAAAVVAPSAGVAADLRERYGLDPSRVRTIPNPVDVTRIRALAQASPAPARGGPLRIRAVGRLARQKGFDLLLRAVALVGDRLPAALEVSIAGEGPDRPALTALAAQLGIADGVALGGVTRRPFAFLAEADLFVMSSRWEGFPNALAEAMAVGIPVVATRVPGIDEVVEDGVTGVLCDPESPEALADGIARMLSDHDLRARCVQAASAYVERYDAPLAAASYAALFTEVTRPDFPIASSARVI